MVQHNEQWVKLTAWMRAPPPAMPFVTATALPLERFVSDFWRLTTIWDDRKELEAGRFAADIFAVTMEV